jgi:hypothetical protein
MQLYKLRADVKPFTHVARVQLYRILSNIQTNMIQNLQRILLSGSSVTQLDCSSLLDITHHSKLHSISALAQQYQRFCTAAYVATRQPAPVDRPLYPTSRQGGSVISTSSIATPDWCTGAIDFQLNEHLRGHTQRFSMQTVCSSSWRAEVPMHGLLEGFRRRVGVYEREGVDGAYEPSSNNWWVSVV